MSENNSSYSTTSTISIFSINLEEIKPKYVHVVKHSSADSLVATIPRPYCKALELSKGDLLAMTLDGNRVIMEKV